MLERGENSLESSVERRSSRTEKILKAVRAVALGASIFSSLEAAGFDRDLIAQERSATQESEASRIARKKEKLQEIIGDNVDRIEDSYVVTNQHLRPGDYSKKPPEEKDYDITKKVIRGPDTYVYEANSSLLHVDGSEGNDGMFTPEMVRQILTQTYPKNWVNGQVSYFSQERDPRFIDSPILGTPLGFGPEYGIGLNTSVRKWPLQYVVHAISHELSHMNDFRTDHQLTIEESLDLALGITQRLVSKDANKEALAQGGSGSVGATDSEQQDFNYTALKEYWAEICAQYFDNRDKLNVQDVILVESIIKKNDPMFDYNAAKERREHLIKLGKKLKK
jgi:hypothetical protein